MAIVYSIIIVTFIACLILTPLVIKFCRKYGFVDIPKDSRRVHSKPMPRIGGIAIVASVFIGLILYILITKDIPSIALNHKAYGYMIGGLLIFAMGLIDDIWSLRARHKFIFQLLAAITIYSFGIRIADMKIPFIYTDTINLGSMALPTIMDLIQGTCNITQFFQSFLTISFPITLIWVIGLTNAVNLIDGLDGLAAGISAISATALLIIFITTSASLEAIIITAVLVGATLGFLPYNFNPAKTFMRRL